MARWGLVELATMWHLVYTPPRIITPLQDDPHKIVKLRNNNKNMDLLTKNVSILLGKLDTFKDENPITLGKCSSYFFSIFFFLIFFLLVFFSYFFFLTIFFYYFFFNVVKV